MKFFDPAKKAAQEIKQLIPDINSQQGSLAIYASEWQDFYQEIIEKLGFDGVVTFCQLS